MDFFGKPCPVCSRTFREEDDVVVCPKCGAPYHRECFQEKGKCVFPDLHRNHQSWQEMQNDAAEPASEEENGTVCPRCGTSNPDHAIVCKNCGAFLAKGIGSDDSQRDSGAYSAPENGMPPFGKGMPITMFMDPLGGVSPEEDFDGVSGSELADYVQNNTSYYLPVFLQYKKQKRRRFNFCAFLFVGGWYLYRKQYVKGALLSLLYLINELTVLLCTVFVSTPLIKEANAAFSNGYRPNISDYLTWGINHKSFGEVVLLFLPYILYILFLVIRIFCGLRANSSYYKHSVNAVKKIKAASSEEVSDLKSTIANSGGVNRPIAWVCLVCYLILSFASFFI